MTNTEVIDSQLIRWGLKTIGRICKKCTYRKEEREGMTFEYWTNKDGVDVQMKRSDGGGYIQMCNQYGTVFASVFLSPGEEPTAALIEGSGDYRTNMQWFMAYT